MMFSTVENNASLFSEGVDVQHQIGATSGVGTYIVAPEKEDYINHIRGRSGLLVDRLEFESSKGRTFGPFGGDGGDYKNLMGSIPSNYELVGLKGTRVFTNEVYFIRKLRFGFRPINKKGKIRRSSKKTMGESNNAKCYYKINKSFFQVSLVGDWVSLIPI